MAHHPPSWVAALTAGALALWPAEAQEAPVLLPDEQNTVEVVQRVGPSVVAVRVSLNGEDVHPGPEVEISGGSGFVVDAQGHVITNFHVVALALDPTDDQLRLRPEISLGISFLGSPEEEHPVRVVGANPDIDIALLAPLHPDQVPQVPPVPLADSNRVAVGQKAIAIGNPFGLHSSVTAGLVSAVERERPGLVGIEIPYIQTDAAINPGNSGGPLLNSSGEVMGINNAVLGPVGLFTGVGLAVPSNLLREALPELRAGGFSGFAAAAAELPDRPRLGLEVALSVSDYPPRLRSRLGLPEAGVVVTSVVEDGPADRAGLVGPSRVIMVGGRPFPAGMDVITAIEGQPVTRALDVQRVILERGPGDVVTLTVWRDGESRQVRVPLEVVERRDRALEGR